MKRVLVVDDHPALRRGLAALFADLGVAEVGEAGSLAAAAEALSESWDLVILDIQLPDGDSLEFLRAQRAGGMRAPVLVHSMLPELTTVAQVFKCGGNGYINKGCEPEELTRAALKVADGGSYISSAYAEVLATTVMVGQPALPHESLSPREFQVMSAIAQGKSPAQVAELVGCKVNTLSAYRARILKKLGVHTTAEIMQYAVKHRLVRF